jgi:hypothetical protein
MRGMSTPSGEGFLDGLAIAISSRIERYRKKCDG